MVSFSVTPEVKIHLQPGAAGLAPHPALAFSIWSFRGEERGGEGRRAGCSPSHWPCLDPGSPHPRQSPEEAGLVGAARNCQDGCSWSGYLRGVRDSKPKEHFRLVAPEPHCCRWSLHSFIRLHALIHQDLSTFCCVPGSVLDPGEFREKMRLWNRGAPHGE